MGGGNTHVLGNIQDEGGFTHGWAGSDDDEITLLETARQGVQGRKSAGESRNGFLVFKLPADFLQLVLHSLPDGGKIGPSLVPRHFEDRLFRIVRNVRHILPFGIGFVGDSAGRIDEAAELVVLAALILMALTWVIFSVTFLVIFSVAEEAEETAMVP